MIQSALQRRRSLFAATIALLLVAGAATAPGAAQTSDPLSITSAVEYEDESGTSYVEVVTDQPVDASNGVVVESPAGVSVTSTETTNSNRIVAELSGDVTPNQVLDVALTENGTVVDRVTDVTTTATAVNEANTSDIETVYKGEPVALVADAANDDILIQGPQATISTSMWTNSRVFVFDTGRDAVSAGDDFVVEFQGSNPSAGFNVTSLGLEATATSTDISDVDQLQVDVYSNAGGPATFEVTDSNGNVDATAVKTLTGGQEETFDLGTVEAGNYTVNVTDNQTSVLATTGTIAVREASASFEGDGVFSEHVGDVVDVPVQLEHTETATVVIGSADSNYLNRLVVQDANGDGRVVVAFNTYTAGSQDDGYDVAWARGDDTVTEREERGAFDPARPEADVLDAGNYDVNVSAGNQDFQFRSDDIGVVDVRTRSTDSVTVWKTNPSTDVRDWTATDVWNAAGDTLAQSTHVADGDVVVFQVDASGIEGVLANRSHGNATKAFVSEIQAGDGRSAFGFYSQDLDPAPDTVPEDVPITENDTIVVADPANDTYFVASWTDAVRTEQGQVPSLGPYEATFTVRSDHPLATSENDTVTARYTVEEPDASITTQDGLVQVEAARDQDVSGTTNLAPGSEIALRIQSDSDSSPFVKQPTATVLADGTWTATADFHREDVGTNFTVRIMEPSAVATTTRVPGRIVGKRSTPTPTPRPCQVQYPAAPALSDGTRPLDVDGDGVYEDLNGNCQFDADDVVTFFQKIEDPAIQENAGFYDLNDNGNADFDDVVTLFQQL